MAQIGFRGENNDSYLYMENDAGGSLAIGTDFNDGSKLKIVTSDSLTDVTPSGTAQLIIDPAANGDITITPHGVGDLIVSSLSTGVVQADAIGTLSSSIGTDGQLLIGATAASPIWASLTSVGGSLTITPGANTLDIAINAPISVPNGGTGATTLTNNGVLVGSGAAAITALAVGTNGQVLLGSTGADPVFASLTSTGGTINFTPGAGSLNLETDGSVATTFNTDGASATPAAGVLTIAGGTNIATSGAGSTVTINFDGTLPVTSGGTGATTLTDHGVLVGSGASPVTALSVGTNGQVLIGSTGADPAFASITSTGGSIVFTPGAGSLNLEAVASGSNGLIQQVNSTSSALFQTAAVIPLDDTIPQNTEGAEFLTVSITPTRTTSTLYIRCEFSASAGITSDTDCTVALFQDSTADALSSASFDINGSKFSRATLTHTMTAGTTSSTTFKIRVGSATGANLEINGDGSAGRLYGGVSNAVLYVYEIAPGLGDAGFGWTEVTTTPGPTQMATNTGYIANAAGSVGLTLPTTASVGDIIRIAGKGSGGWDVVQGAGQTIHFGSTDTTTGVGGSLASTNRYDSIEMLCTIANTDFTVLSSVGNITIV